PAGDLGDILYQGLQLQICPWRGRDRQPVSTMDVDFICGGEVVTRVGRGGGGGGVGLSSGEPSPVRNLLRAGGAGGGVVVEKWEGGAGGGVAVCRAPRAYGCGGKHRRAGGSSLPDRDPGGVGGPSRGRAELSADGSCHGNVDPGAGGEGAGVAAPGNPV